MGRKRQGQGEAECVSCALDLHANEVAERTRLSCDDALAILLEDADLAPAVNLDAADGNLAEVLVDERLDDVPDVVVPECRVGREPNLDCE